MSDKETFVIDNPAAQGWTDSGTTAGGSPVWNWDEDTYAVGEAPIDGKQYARQDANWSEVVIPEGSVTLWQPNGADIYYSAGNVGVGTNAPAAQFEVKGSNTNARFRGAGSQLMNFNFTDESPSIAEIDVRNSANFHISKQGVPALTIDNSNNSFFSGALDISDSRFKMWVGNAGTEVSLSFRKQDTTEAIRIYSDESSNFNFWDGANSINRMQLDVSGNVFIHGAVYATDFISTSDERLKDNIATAPVGLIDSLKGREWDWKESGEKGSGVVAQELEQVLPHLVSTDDEGMKSVSYMGLCAYLIEELKDCRERLAVLEAKE